MANNKLFYSLGAIAGVYFLTKKETPKNPSITQIDILPAAPAGPTIYDPTNTPINGVYGVPVEDITATSQPNFETWQRPQWTAYFMDNYTANGLEQASQTTWTNWSNASNENKDRFPTLESFIFNLTAYKMASNIGEIITADSAPIYGTWSNWWNNIHYWNCTEWMQWYDLNAQKYGTAKAQAKFVDGFSHNDNNSSLAFDPMGYTCGYDCDFTNYMRTKGIDVSNFGTQNTCTLVSIPTNLIDAGAATSEAVKTTAQTLNYVGPVFVAGLAGIFLFSQYNKAKQA